MDKFYDSIIGHAIGDAMGVPTEFCLRENLEKNPVTDMVGTGTYNQPAGSWSDDTSMELATIDSFIQKGQFDYDDILTKWQKWLNNNEYTPNNFVFDVGRTCLKAIHNHYSGIPALECGLASIDSNGNGSLMRMLPVALYAYYRDLKDEEIIELTNNISSLTHRHNISKLGCYIYVRYIMFLLDGKDKNEAYNLLRYIDYSSYDEESISKYERILKNSIKDYPLSEISSSGYVVHTLECALWILLNTNSFEEAILKSTNIGEDTDTVGAVTGSMAGIIYGSDSIPKKWINTLLKESYIKRLSNAFKEKVLGDSPEELPLNKISKEDFLKLSEDDVVLITNPGRMGDEDGTTFVTLINDKYTMYRIDGWMYPSRDRIKENFISMEDVKNHFPKWFNSWEESSDNDKYKRVYMGFGNGLCIDKRIYDNYYYILRDLVKSDSNYKEDSDGVNGLYFKYWEKAFYKMIKK